MPKEVRAIAFDAYGTLFDVHSVTSLAEQLFPGRGAELSQLWRQKQLEYSWLRTMSERYAPFREITRDALRFSARRLALAMDEADEERLMKQYASLSAFPENLAALRALRDTGLPLAILTNGDPDMVAISVRSAGMQGLFDYLLSAYEVGCFKTRREVYALAPAAFGCEPAQILFVSSNAWDAIAATWFGFQTFWVNRSGAPLDELGTAPSATGHRLSDVVDHVRARFRGRPRGTPEPTPFEGESR